MKSSVFRIHDRLRAFPPAQGVYILYRRIIEQGIAPTWLWIKDKVIRRTEGFSIPPLSKVAPYLYVGGQHRQNGLDRMRELGITAILNLREESDDKARGVTLDAYLWLPITDDAAPSVEELTRGVIFIEGQIAQERGVYVHCASGVGRAPTMAAAYFVYCGASPQEAWDIIRRVRPFVRPTPPQLEVIREFAHHQTDDAPPEGRGARSPDRDLPPQTMEKSPQHRASVTSATSQSAPSPESSQTDRRLQMAYERVAGDPNITADLTDDEAQELLSWAQEETKRLVNTTQGMTEEDAWRELDPKLAHLRRYLRRTAKESAAAEDAREAIHQTLQAPDYPGA